MLGSHVLSKGASEFFFYQSGKPKSMADIIYVLKNGIVSDELRYSLRSLDNFPHDRVWFVGGMPQGFKPDKAMTFIQDGSTKWERVRNSLMRVCTCEDMTEDVWLFNDDFFIMERIDELPPMYRGTLEQRVSDIEHRRGYLSTYAKQLRMCATDLRVQGFSTLDYALHVPMLINRAKARETLERFKCPMFRSLYGNHHKIGGIKADDVKVAGKDTEPKRGKLLSTDGSSFEGKAGAYIREMFPNPSRFETWGRG